VLTIRCAFDEEFGPDGVDPLGNIVIADDCSAILIETTYLDSWLAALIDTLPHLSVVGHFKVEAEEPDPVDIEVIADGSLHISYRQQRVVAARVREFEFALRSAVGAFLGKLENSPNVARNRLIDPIRRFWLTAEN
jgi:hypothetical protein